MARKPLSVTEQPLVAMDAAVLPELPTAHTAADGVDRILALKHACRRVGGAFTWLFHNDRWTFPVWREIHAAVLSG